MNLYFRYSLPSDADVDCDDGLTSGRVMYGGVYTAQQYTSKFPSEQEVTGYQENSSDHGASFGAFWPTGGWEFANFNGARYINDSTSAAEFGWGHNLPMAATLGEATPIMYDYDAPDDGWGFAGWHDYEPTYGIEDYVQYPCHSVVGSTLPGCLGSNYVDGEEVVDDYGNQLKEYHHAIWIRYNACYSHNRCLFMGTKEDVLNTDTEGYPQLSHQQNRLAARLNQFQKI